MKARFILGFVATATLALVAYLLSQDDAVASSSEKNGAPAARLGHKERPAPAIAPASIEIPAAPAANATPLGVTLAQQELTALDYIVVTRRRELYALLLDRADIQWIDDSTVTIATELSDTQQQLFRDAVRYDILSLLGAERSELLLSSTAKGNSIRDDLENYGSNKLVIAMKFDGAGLNNSSRIKVVTNVLDPARGRDFGYTLFGSYAVSDLDRYLPGASARLQQSKEKGRPQAALH